MRIILFSVGLFISSHTIGQEVINLASPKSENEVICGAGYVTFTATSELRDSNLRFEWFEISDDGSLKLLGSLDGLTGKSQFITSLLIADTRFAVRVRIGNSLSPYNYVKAEVINEAAIVQRPAIQLCGQVRLEAETDMDSINGYQWQVLVPNEFGQSFFQNLNTESSDSSVFITDEVGFYRVVVTDDAGCKGISSEIEVTNNKVVKFIDSKIICYDSGEPSSNVMNLISDYGRSFTEYLWEESLDSVTFTGIGTEKSVEISRPSVQPYDTVYYRLTLKEQNCSNDTTIAVYWRPKPAGEISHIDPLIGQSDFFFCGDDPESARTLKFTSSSLGIRVAWYAVSYSKKFSQAVLKSYSSQMIDENLIELFAGDMKPIGMGAEVVLNQRDGDRLGIDGGLIFAIVTDTVASSCRGFTNAIFANTSFPFPTNGSDIAYEYPNGMSFIPVCRDSDLVLPSYDLSADDYSWKLYDELTNSFIEIDTNDTLTISVDDDYSEGIYALEVTKNGCSGFSSEFKVVAFDEPSVKITNIEDEASACNKLSNVLLFGQGSNDVSGYQWLYSANGGDNTYDLALGDSAKHFYRATKDGYYKLVASNSFCQAETKPVFVQIPKLSNPGYVEVELEGAKDYCVGDEIEVTCNYEGSSATYFWYYSFFQLDGNDVSIQLVELGKTTTPNITLDTRAFESANQQPLTLYFYILVIDGECVAGSTDIPFVVTINPTPNIELIFQEFSMLNELFLCSDELINEEVKINNLTGVDIGELTYLWTRYNPENDDYDTLEQNTENNYFITQPGRYRSIATSQDGVCFSSSNTLDLMTLPNGIAGDSIFCFGNDISLSAIQGYIPDLNVYAYQWYHSIDGNVYTPIVGKTFPNLTLSVGDELYGSGFFYYESSYDGCTKASKKIEIREDSDSFKSRLILGNSHEKGIPFEAIVDVNLEANEITYQWEPSAFIGLQSSEKAIFSFPEDYPSDSVTISVNVSKVDGCSVVHSQVVQLKNLSSLKFSRFVSPNGDGLNDYFQINGLDSSIPNNLQIFDSWGTRLFSFDNYHNLPQQADALINSIKTEGVYYYIFSAGETFKKGSFFFTK